MTTLYIVLGVIAVLVLWIVFAYNRFVVFNTRIKEAWSDIDVQLKRRYDLIPNLIETVKGYMTHESQVFEKVTEARTRAMGVTSAKEKAEQENILSGTLKTLFAVSENKIQAARRFFNSNVRDFNILVDSFPANLIAGVFNYKKQEFFELNEA